jgi:hypothetical protein
MRLLCQNALIINVVQSKSFERSKGSIGKITLFISQNFIASPRRLPMVCRLTGRPWVPMVAAAVRVAGWIRLRRWDNRTYRSCRTDVTRGRPDRGRSLKWPVCRYRRTFLLTVLGLTPKKRATWVQVIPD